VILASDGLWGVLNNQVPLNPETLSSLAI